MDEDIRKLKKVKKYTFSWTGQIAIFSIIASTICLIICLKAISGSNVDFLKNSEIYTMPNLVGMTQSDCNSMDIIDKLNIEFIRTPQNKEKAGIIISQSIEAGKKVTNNQTITVKVSSWTEIVQVPNSVGQDINQTKIALKNIGLDYDIVYISSEGNEMVETEPNSGKFEPKINTHTVVKLEPSQYSLINEGETVKVYVERPFIDTVRTVPSNLYGKTWNDAVSLMEEANISNYLIYYVASEGRYNTVVSVWPTGNISIDDKVYIKVSGGPTYGMAQ